MKDLNYTCNNKQPMLMVIKFQKHSLNGNRFPSSTEMHENPIIYVLFNPTSLDARFI